MEDIEGPQVVKDIIPYHSNQLVRFENGKGDTLVFRCTKYKVEEKVFLKKGDIPKNHCYTKFHQFNLMVDLTSTYNSYMFNLRGIESSVFLEHHTNNTVNFKNPVGDSRTVLTENITLYDSIHSNGEKFYKYTESVFQGINLWQPYLDTIRYTQKEGIIFFCYQNKAIGVNERWVLVK